MIVMKHNERNGTVAVWTKNKQRESGRWFGSFAYLGIRTGMNSKQAVYVVGFTLWVWMYVSLLC